MANLEHFCIKVSEKKICKRWPFQVIYLQSVSPFTKLYTCPGGGRGIFRKSTESYILGTFCLLFLKFALIRGRNFGAYAPFWRPGFKIPKWDTRVQKSGKSPPPPAGHMPNNIPVGLCGTHACLSILYHTLLAILRETIKNVWGMDFSRLWCKLGSRVTSEFNVFGLIWKWKPCKNYVL